MFISKPEAEQIIKEISGWLKLHGFNATDEYRRELASWLWRKGGLTWDGSRWIEETRELTETQAGQREPKWKEGE